MSAQAVASICHTLTKRCSGTWPPYHDHASIALRPELLVLDDIIDAADREALRALGDHHDLSIGAAFNLAVVLMVPTASRWPLRNLIEGGKFGNFSSPFCTRNLLMAIRSSVGWTTDQS